MLDDRSYMREDPHRSIWNASVILMVTLVVCFALQQIVKVYTDWPLGQYLALSTRGLESGFVWQLITFQFLHGSLLHLLGNLLVIYFFGRFVEARLGSKKFLIVYLLCGVAGGLLQMALGWILPNTYGLLPVLGASAGVSALIAIFALMEPEAQILIWFVLPLKAKHLLWFELAVAAFFTIVPTDPGIAHAAHLGGILTAIGYMRWDARRTALAWNPLESRRRKRQLVQTAAQVARWRPRRGEAAAGGELPPEEFISREVDPILDKISAHGIHSLTAREKEILEAARAKMSRR